MGSAKNYAETTHVNWCHLEQTGLYGMNYNECLAQWLTSNKHLQVFFPDSILSTIPKLGSTVPLKNF